MSGRVTSRATADARLTRAHYRALGQDLVALSKDWPSVRVISTLRFAWMKERDNTHAAFSIRVVRALTR